MADICNLCPRQCNIDRTATLGYCQSPDKVRIARVGLHEWEEPCISYGKGSGTIFFSGCNMRCVFCQNCEISSFFGGKEISVETLADEILSLQDMGASNINFVTPTHYADKIVKALDLVKHKLEIPTVYNTSSYEKTETLKMLEGYVDIYLPDLKYFDSAPALKYSGAEDYFEYASAAVLEMQRQVGTVRLDPDGITKSGLIIRHMVLPGNISQAVKVFSWVRENLPENTYISVMRQYVPFGKAKEIPPINRRLSAREYSIVKQKILALGFENCYFQSGEAAEESFIPNFNLEGVDL